MSPKPQLDVALAGALVCEAARRSALEAIALALLIAGDRTGAAPDRARDVANQVLSRAALMERELSLLFTMARSPCKLLYGGRTGDRPS